MSHESVRQQPPLLLWRRGKGRGGPSWPRSKGTFWGCFGRLFAVQSVRGQAQSRTWPYFGHALLALLVWTLGWGGLAVNAAETNIVRFTQPAPYASEEEIGRRFGFAVVPPDYDLSRERFLLEVPSPQETNLTRGLLVWLSPGDQAYFPPAWQEELTAHNIILVAPFDCGEERHPIDRLRVALDATCNVCRKYRIDRSRIYVGGFRGGARLASMLGIACGDIFTGTLCVSGVNFHLHVPVDGIQYYPGSFYPNPEIVQYSRRKGRFALITGQGDPEFDRIKAVVERGFKRDGFKNIWLLQVSWIAQDAPESGTLNQVLSWLDGSAPAVPAVNGSAERR